MTKRNLIVAVAGHIDHGKTSLVKVLTGTDTDRLPEERKRGLSIEPGFAYLETPKFSFDFVDIPGHQNYLPNALRSLFEPDFAILTVAANDGVMPQTIEHLEVLKGLNLKEGLVVLTKCDLVDVETLRLAETEIAQLVENSPFQNKPIIRFSLIWNSGKEEIIAHLEQLALNLSKKSDGKLFRFFIDRAFILKGKGKVVTGLATSGQLEEGEKLQVYPQESLAVVREIERHGEKITKIQERERAGLNLSTKEVLKRGLVLGKTGELKPSCIVNVELTVFSSSPRPLFNREKVFVYHYSTETTAKVVLWGKEKLKPSESALAQLRLTSPIIPFFGDPLIIRFFAPRTTSASGTIIDAHSIKLRQGNCFYFENLQTLFSPNEKALLAPLTRSYYLSISDLSQETGFTFEAIIKKTKALAQEEKIIFIDQDTLMGKARFNQARLIIANKLKEIKENSFLPSCLTSEELYTRLSLPLPLKVFKFLMKTTAVQLDLYFKENRYWFKAPSLTKKQARLRDLILQRLSADLPLRQADLLSLPCEKKLLLQILNSILKEGLALKLKDGAFLSKRGFEFAKKKIINHFQIHKELTVREAKELLGWGRRATISFLEHLDTLKITFRQGDKRFLNRQ